MWNAILEKAAELEAHRKDEEAREAAARMMARLDAQDAVRSELIGLLGPLADELEITTYDRSERGRLVFLLRPRHWRPDILNGFYARWSDGDGGWRKGWTLATYARGGDLNDITLTAEFATGGDARELVLWLAARQDEYDQAVARRVKSAVESLEGAAGYSRHTPETAAAARDELVELWPHETARWDALYASWRADYEAETAETAAALGRLRGALKEWRRVTVNIDEVNQANIDRLIKRIDIPVTVRDLEYAVVANDAGEPFPVLETRTVQVEAMLAETHRATVLRDGKLTAWQFFNPVRLGDPYSVRPSVAAAQGLSHLFVTVFTPYGAVVFTEHFRAEVEQVVNSLAPAPAEPKWSEIGGGRPWTEAVKELYDEVLDNE